MIGSGKAAEVASRRQASVDGKKIAKLALLGLEQYSGIEWLRDRVWTARRTLPAPVLLFHRVTDDIPEDGLTVSKQRFRAIVRNLRRLYRPMSLTGLLDHMEHGQIWPARTVVVTFDDGYRDNYEHAAPILAESAVPATFFVTADAIGSECVMSWDEQLRGRVPWMNWSQVRELRAQGFEIGSHTLMHSDLGKVRAPRAWEEISTSKTRLEDALGAGVSLFAYPFGGRKNISEENRDLVRRAAYRCCCSAYGGFVTLGSDPFNLQRIPVNNWFSDPHDLDFEIRIGAPWRWLQIPGDRPVG
jgi:peptidoglycan/xylan/chitin deacetylase (PgdA/CDA1 family)